MHRNEVIGNQPAPSAPAAMGCWEDARLLRPQRGPILQVGSVDGFEWNVVELAVEGMARELDGTRILHVTDLHFRSRWPVELDQFIEQVRAQRPDLILLGGDLVHDSHDIAPSLPMVERLVKGLGSRHGIYAVLGNHDGDLLGPPLEAWGVRVLWQERVELALGEGLIELIGLPGVERLDLDLSFIGSVPPRRAGVPRIVLSHFPDSIRFTAALHADVYLAGHTHGGQICLPKGTPIMRHDSLPRGLCTGLHRYGDTWLIVNRGLGFAALQVRAFCPAEVVEVRLKRKT